MARLKVKPPDARLSMYQIVTYIYDWKIVDCDLTRQWNKRNKHQLQYNNDLFSYS